MRKRRRVAEVAILRDTNGRRLPVDETGNVYGRLTVLRRGEPRLTRDAYHHLIIGDSG